MNENQVWDDQSKSYVEPMNFKKVDSNKEEQQRLGDIVQTDRATFDGFEKSLADNKQQIADWRSQSATMGVEIEALNDLGDGISSELAIKRIRLQDEIDNREAWITGNQKQHVTIRHNIDQGNKVLAQSKAAYNNHVNQVETQLTAADQSTIDNRSFISLSMQEKISLASKLPGGIAELQQVMRLV